MQYREYVNANGERFWLPLLAGAAIISAPLWLGAAKNNQCCNSQGCMPCGMVVYPQVQSAPPIQPMPNYMNPPYYSYPINPYGGYPIFPSAR